MQAAKPYIVVTIDDEGKSFRILFVGPISSERLFVRLENQPDLLELSVCAVEEERRDSPASWFSGRSSTVLRELAAKLAGQSDNMEKIEGEKIP